MRLLSIPTSTLALGTAVASAFLNHGPETITTNPIVRKILSTAIRSSRSRRNFSSSSSLITTEEIDQQQQQQSDETTDDDSMMNNKAAYYRIYYNDVYKVDLPPKHRFPMNKYEQVRKQVQKQLLPQQQQQQQQNKVQCDFHISPLATFEELVTTHSPEYVTRFMNGNITEREQRNVGFPWSQQGVQRALSSVGGTMAAACDVCDLWQQQQQQKRRQHHLSDEPPFKEILAPWGAHIAGGTHHAFYDYGEGFSVFSDIAVGCNVVLQRYPTLIQRILIIDLDTHQGNGNAVLFHNNPNVVTFSMHCEGNFFSEKQNSDLDIELPIDCNDQTYLMTLNHWLNLIEKQQEKYGHFDLIFYQSGVDILEDDRLGRMSITQKGVARRNELVFKFANKLNIPLVICMGGGYPRTDDWTPIIEAHTNVYCQAHQFLSDKMEEMMTVTNEEK